MGAIRYRKTAERPGLQLWLLDDDLSLIDLSGYDSFMLKIGHIGQPASLIKTSQITGQLGAGAEPDGTPNCVVTWLPGELAVLDAGLYDMELTATLSLLDRVFYDSIEILDVMT